MLHAILDRDIFDKEVEKRSRLFESNIVKEEFEKQGFTYLLNQGIKNKMQIDGIAISNSIVYVIEVKGWKAKDLIQDSYTREILEEEIRNAIDGLGFTRNSGNTRKKVSLPQKVEWVKNQRKKLGISAQAGIIGMLVINREPVISEYKDCIIRYVDDFEFN